MIKLGCNTSLPSGWQWAEAGKVIDIRDGTHDSPKPVEDGIPLVTSKNLKSGKIDFSTCTNISAEDHEQISKRSAVDDGDILYAMIGTIGNPVIVQGDRDFSIKNVALFKFSKSQVFNRYFYHLLGSSLVTQQFEKNARGGTQKFVSLGNIRALQIPLPPLEEQKRIAAILDKADVIRQKRKQAIDLADEFLRSVFLDMFGDPVTNPKGWEVKPVGELVECIVPGRDKPKSFTGEMPWITTNDLQHLGTTTNSDKGLGLSDEEISSVKARIIPKGSVLMTCVGDLGIISIAGNNLVMNQQLHAFLNSEYFEQEFLMFALSFQKQYMLKMASSTTVPYMNKTICNSVPVIVPTLPLQQQFKKIYLNTVSTIEKYQSASCEKLSLCSSLSQKAFSGQL